MFFINFFRRLFKSSASQTFNEDRTRKANYYPSFLTIYLLKKNWKRHVETIPKYPDKYKGKGIVICGGGPVYFTCAWININMLRKKGCKLPIELWYLEGEITDELIEQLNTLDVTCKNITDSGGGYLSNYALKPYCVINSSFEEILFLDADNNCWTDPTFLFDTPEFEKNGAVFWPDFWITGKRNPIWKILGIKSDGTNEQESGQILINKKKCWKALNLCFFLNVNRRFYYRMLLGDKDTFKLAWRALNTDFKMIETPVAFCGYQDQDDDCFVDVAMVQYDLKGELLFLHRNGKKWFFTEHDKKAMMEIIRYKKDAKEKKMVEHFTKDNSFFCLDGDIETIDAQDLLGTYEDECLVLLKELRELDVYVKFVHDAIDADHARKQAEN
ncbi:MAG: alpha 1,2-mannosyltransferase [Crocinitomix sp.]|jgi:alpha 1,2-mannosyltransferase